VQLAQTAGVESVRFAQKLTWGRSEDRAAIYGLLNKTRPLELSRRMIISPNERADGTPEDLTMQRLTATWKFDCISSAGRPADPVRLRAMHALQFWRGGGESRA